MMNAAARVTAIAGSAVTSLGAFPAFDAIRQSLPMVQAFTIMAIIICLPIVTVMSSYDLKVLMTLTFVLFGTYALSFWWELARWIDSWILEALYGSDTHSYWNLAGIQNTSDDILVNFVMGSMFIILPAFWMGAMGWAGVKVGHAVSNISGSGSATSGDAGRKGGDLVAKGGQEVSKGIGKS
ncbi:conjugal transfer protein TraG N-terminal domain-containing protein [Aggregatibacter actinomycetemcomitans]|nr:conjugal transfer protein TraG N-terminal domain-containing protein [Aggregatibacter actinomycetemcomitans]